MPLLSVIIPSYNRVRYIGATLDSLLAQKFTDYEVIVVDDGSTDNTLEVLRRYPAVRVLKHEQQGPGAARNCGAAASSGTYLAFLDSDDLWFSWTLQTFADIIATQNEPDLIAARLIEFHKDPELARITKEALRIEVFEDYYEASRTRLFVGACIMVVRRSVFSGVGGFQTQTMIYAEDCDLAMRLGLVRRFVQILSPVTLGYRQHATNARRDITRIYLGTMFLVESERAGKYPGGETRKIDRIRLITLHTRPFSLGCLRNGNQRPGWTLYGKTLLWHLQILRWKYLFGFPVFAAYCWVIGRLAGERRLRVAAHLA